nr:immunoglobulin heavy chain junction region [Macaca mulatta]
CTYGSTYGFDYW